MPQSKVDRVIDRSCRPCFTNEMTSLRALDGATKSGCDSYSSISLSAYAESRKK